MPCLGMKLRGPAVAHLMQRKRLSARIRGIHFVSINIASTDVNMPYESSMLGHSQLSR